MRDGTLGIPDGLIRLWTNPERRLQILALLVGVGVVVAASIVWMLRGDVADVEYWKAFGYPGVFFLSFLGSVSVILPVPGLIAVCGAGGLELNLVALGLFSGAGETIGEMSGYAIGYGGRTVVEKRAFYEKVRLWMERRGTLVILLVSVIPNPFFDVVGIAAGGLRYPLLRFLAIVLVGKTLKGLIVAHTCFWLADFLPWG
jgi:membrane protein YqaA with SNARE-associated domain